MRPSLFCIDASIVQASCLDRREIGDTERRHGRAGGGVVCGRLGVYANVGTPPLALNGGSGTD